MAGLRVGDLNLLRNRVRIARSGTPVAGRGLVWSDPKTHEKRDVPIPGWLSAELANYVRGLSPNRQVFEGERGAVLRVHVFRKAALDGAVADVLPGLPGFHPHELRHTAASLAIDAGADVKLVQRMLGHKNATMTLNRYGHLFEFRLDEVSAALDRARDRALTEAGVAPMLPRLAERRNVRTDSVG